MKTRIIIPVVLLFSVLVFGFVTLRSAQKPKSPCKGMECCKKKSSGSSPEGPIMESLPRQFFSSIQAR
jgi:hypothetical protein